MPHAMQFTLKPIARGWVCHGEGEGRVATATCRFAICAFLKCRRELRRSIRLHKDRESKVRDRMYGFLTGGQGVTPPPGLVKPAPPPAPPK